MRRLARAVLGHVCFRMPTADCLDGGSTNQMSHMPPPLSASPPPRSVASSATYQTNLNPPGHSKSCELRLTLKMLSILRVPLMVRSAFIVFLLGTFLSASAVAALMNAVRSPEHASVKK